MVMEWPWLWTSAQAAIAATLLAFPLAFALGWRASTDPRAALLIRVLALLPAPALLAAWSRGTLLWIAAAGLLVALAALARETSIHLAALPSPWFESLRTLGAPAWRAAWPALRRPLLLAALWTAARVLLESLAGLILRGGAQ